MVLRSVVGALVTVAVLGAVAAALPEHSSTKRIAAAQPPFGELARPGFQNTTAASAVVPPDQSLAQQGLMKLASYSKPQPPAPAAAPKPEPAVQARPAADAVSRIAAVPSEAILAFAPTSPDGASSLTTAKTPAPPTVKDADRAPPRTVLAKVESEPPSPPARSNGQVNINKAPVEALDHLPGGGRIGISIVRRRPYASIDDLVRKRVLRKSAFARIRSAITVD